MQYRTETLLKGSRLTDQERADEATAKREQLVGTIHELERKGEQDTLLLVERMTEALADARQGQLLTVERVKALTAAPDDRGYRGEFGYRKREVEKLRTDYEQLQPGTVVEASDLTLFLESALEAGTVSLTDSNLKQAGFDVSPGRLIARARRK